MRNKLTGLVDPLEGESLVRYVCDAVDALRCTSPEQIARARTIKQARADARADTINRQRFTDDEDYRNAASTELMLISAEQHSVIGYIGPDYLRREQPTVPPVVLGQGEYQRSWPQPCRVDVPWAFTHNGELRNPLELQE